MAAQIDVSELAKHSTKESCWVSVNGKVYDLTEFAPNHPGGSQIIYKYAGKDGSKAYNTIHDPNLIEKELTGTPNIKGLLDHASIGDIDEQDHDEVSIDEPLSSSKPRLAQMINLEDFERAFEAIVPAQAVSYTRGASNDQVTLSNNKAAWRSLWFRPRVMRNMANVNTNSKLLGVDLAAPVFISPMGLAKTAGEEAERALARGSAAAGIGYCLCTTASLGPEEILDSAPRTYPYYFQLYMNRDRSKTEGLLRRLNSLDQIKAIMVTADMAVMSKREESERLKSQIEGIESQYAMWEGNRQSGARSGGLSRPGSATFDPALCWADIPWLQERTHLPILVKGIQTAQDAKKALEMGCAGIVISNHGGRSADTAQATLVTLMEIRRDCPEVFNKMEVLVDGGIRRGSDVLKAILIGAKGVGIGRPFQCSIAFGTDGVVSAAAIVQDELETAMRLTGISDINRARGDLSYLNTSELEKMLPPKPLSTAGSWFFGRTLKL